MGFLRKHFNPTVLILLLILLAGFLLRTYRIEDYAGLGHDEDLASWIVKDILVDHHFRLIGQETSIDGVFIGPLFYYLLVPFYALFRMNPLAALALTNIIALATIVSFYFVFSKFFSKTVGLTAAFFYAVSIGAVLLDRWTVPTQPTILWAVWYFYALLSITHGNVKVLPLVALLIGLIWHVHVAFLPLLTLLPIAVWLSGKSLPSLAKQLTIKTLVISFLLLAVFILPFFAFEIRHDFQQTKSFIISLSQERKEAKGFFRIRKIATNSSRSLAVIFFNTPVVGTPQIVYSLPILLMGLVVYLKIKKVLSSKHIFLISCWVGVILLSQFISKRGISEYYFNNFFVIANLILALFVAFLHDHYQKRFFTYFLLAVYLTTSLSLLSKFLPPQDGYLQKNQLIKYIKSDANSHHYFCIAINYISDQAAKSGFRYLFWLNDLHLITPANDVPVYSIVIPWSISPIETIGRFGKLGVILPSGKSIIDQEACNKPERQLLPLWGFTN